jgi:hypothetical protein
MRALGLHHPELVEAGELAVKGALRGTGLGSAFGGRLAEEDDRADQFGGALPQHPRLEFDLAPVRGRRNPRS